MTETKTVTREAVEVQTTEETLYVCANCPQAFEKDETVAVAIDVDEDGCYAEKQRVCHECCETVLGHTPSDDGPSFMHSSTRLSKRLTLPEKVKESVDAADAIAAALCWVMTFGFANFGFVAPTLIWGAFGVFITLGAAFDTASRWADQ